MASCPVLAPYLHQTLSSLILIRTLCLTPCPWSIPAAETEYRALSPEELEACQRACRPGGARVRDFDTLALLQGLLKRGLIYLDVPIRPTDRVSIPPLEVC